MPGQVRTTSRPYETDRNSRKCSEGERERAEVGVSNTEGTSARACRFAAVEAILTDLTFLINYLCVYYSINDDKLVISARLLDDNAVIRTATD